ncbi:MAG TPA: CPBP family intramembrane metalloprotease [Desulfotomaculum sp.]|nr:CPBP family intramembrane metalloprotease [Desulfotomaculum sp.]
MSNKAAQVLDSQGQVSILKGILEKRESVYPWLYAVGIGLAELLVVVNPRAGVILHMLILAGLLINSTFAYGQPSSKLYITLILGPLIRILSLSLPLAHLPRIYWYAAVSLPLLTGALVAARLNGYRLSDVGLQLGDLRKNAFIHILTCLSGIPLGIAEYFILRPAPLFESFNLVGFILPALILLVCTGFTEEVIFRGIMQKAANDFLGPKSSIFLISFICAVLHITHISFIDVIFVFIVALYFAMLVKRTGSILGVTIAHGITNISLYLVWPFII